MNSKKKILIGGEKIMIGGEKIMIGGEKILIGGPASAFEPVKPKRFDDLDEMFASEEPSKQEKTAFEVGRNERKTALKQIKDLFQRKVLPSFCSKK